MVDSFRQKEELCRGFCFEKQNKTFADLAKIVQIHMDSCLEEWPRIKKGSLRKIESDFQRIEGFKSICFSHAQFRFEF